MFRQARMECGAVAAADTSLPVDRGAGLNVRARRRSAIGWIASTGVGAAAVAIVIGVGSASAQVTIDLRALDPLKPPPPGERASPRPVAPRPRSTEPAAAIPEPPPAPPNPGSQTATGSPPSSTATATVSTTGPAASLPTTAPEAATVTPVPAPVATATAPPMPPPVSNTSTTTAQQSGASMRLTFDSGATDLSPASAATIKEFLGAAPTGDSVTFNVTAYAAGKADDPSVARRLSLSRALAVRNAMIAEGIISSRIYVRALGNQGGSGPADRVDISVLGANTTTAR